MPQTLLSAQQQNTLVNRCLIFTEVNSWFGRDSAHVSLRFDSYDDDSILEYWDDDVQDLIDCGFIDTRDLHRSLVEYAVHLGVLSQSVLDEYLNTEHSFDLD